MNVLNYRGINLLKSDLRDLELKPRPDLFYDQSIFGLKMGRYSLTCMAGLCLRRRGDLVDEHSPAYIPACLTAGCQQLGIHHQRSSIRSLDSVPQIFNSVYLWPADLAADYLRAGTNAARIDASIRALDRLLPNGDIRELDEAQQTESWRRELCGV